MASIIMSGDVPSEVSKMINDFTKGKIGISRLFEFLNDNGIEVKISESKNSECKNDENNEKENYAKDTINFVKRLIENYDNDNDGEEDDDDHIKAIKLCNSLLVLARTYRKRATDGDDSYNIPKFNPENILNFIDSIDLPTDKIRNSFEKRKSFYCKNKIYNDFNEFEKNMKSVYGIEDVWNPQKETPEWFESVRDNLYRKFHPEDVINLSEDEWNEFKEWKEKKNKDFENQCRHIVDDIIKFSPILTGKAINYFEKNYKSNDKTFMNQLKQLFDNVKSVKNCGLICFIDVDEYDRIDCNPIQNTKKDIEEKVLNATSSKSDKPSDKKSSTSKKTTSSVSPKKGKTSTKKTSKTDTGVKIKEFKEYADYILLNSPVEDDAKDLLLSYAANMDERCKKLYDYLVDLKKRKKSVKLIKYHNIESGNTDIGFAEL